MIRLTRADYGYTYLHFEITPCNKQGRGSATHRHGWYVKNTKTQTTVHAISMAQVRLLLNHK